MTDKNFINNNNITKWDFSFQKITQTPVIDPFGFNVNIIDGVDLKSKKYEVAKTKVNRAKDLAFGQGKTIFMTLFSLYFIGSNLSLITIFITGLYAYNSLSSILNVGTSKYLIFNKQN